MNSLFTISLLIVTGISYSLIAYLSSRGISSQRSYLLGDRQFSIKSITMTLIATQLGAGMLFGTAAESYTNGIMGISYNLGMAIGLIILGFGVGGRLRDLEITTTAEIFERIYNSKILRKYASLISIITMGGILSAQIVASKQLFLSLFNLSIIWLILFWLIIIFYTMFGGIRAIIATDIFQVVMIITIFSAVFIIVIPLNNIRSILSFQACDNISYFEHDFFNILVAPALFSIIEQDLAQRFFSAKNKRVASLSAIFAALFLLIYSFVPITLGMYAKLSGFSMVKGESPLILLLQDKLPSFGMTLVACALLAAICSTADSLLGAASSNVIADFINPKNKMPLIISRLITLIIGLCALFTAFFYDNVIELLVKSYEISISALFIPIIFALFLKRPSRLGAFFSTWIGTMTYFLCQFFLLDYSAVLISISFACLFYFCVYIVMSFTDN